MDNGKDSDSHWKLAPEQPALRDWIELNWTELQWEVQGRDALLTATREKAMQQCRSSTAKNTYINESIKEKMSILG